MAEVFFISDLHFGHRNIMNFSGEYRTGDDHIENMHLIIQQWNSVVGKRDLVWVLGDVAFNQQGFDALYELSGIKKLVRGNHDNHFKTEDWLRHFETVEGITTYKGYWLSHCPVHPKEIRGKRGNIHGHVHTNSIRSWKNDSLDLRYVNVCCEAIGETPLSFDLIKSGEWNKIRKL